MQVQIEADDDRIILSLPQPRYQLSDLVANLTHDDLADAFDWGPNESREIVDWRGRS
jgi:antitoxin component of MazEF toxin-antitoxin module